MDKKDNPMLKDVPNLQDKELMSKYCICMRCGRMNFIIIKEEEGNILRCARCGHRCEDQILNLFKTK